MSTLTTRFTELAGVRAPIVQDGMGPYKTVRLAAAVSEAGGLGTVSIPGMTIDPREAARLLREHIEETASLTACPFAVNVPVGRTRSGEMLAVSAAYIGACLDARRSDAGLARQLRVLTTSGGFPGEFREAIAASGVLHMHKVGSTRQAVRAQEAGVDVIIASGYEMGGHTHRLPVHTFVLVPNVTAEVDVPVLLGGGARDGRTLAAALVLGAAGVAMGTRFIATRDNDWHPAYRDRIVQATEGEDVVFRGVYGPARGLRNSALERLAELERVGVDETTLTRWKDAALRRAEIEGDVENGLVAAGQVASGIHDVPSVADLVVRMMSEAIAVIESVSATAVVC